MDLLHILNCWGQYLDWFCCVMDKVVREQLVRGSDRLRYFLTAAYPIPSALVQCVTVPKMLNDTNIDTFFGIIYFR